MTDFEVAILRCIWMNVSLALKARHQACLEWYTAVALLSKFRTVLEMKAWKQDQWKKLHKQQTFMGDRHL